MKITELELFPVPPRWQLLKISTDEGVSGWGEAVVPGRTETVAAAVREMSDWLIGRDPERIQDIWQTLFRGGFFRGGPILMSAIGGIDQALWDIKGKRHGLPVYDLRGGAVRDRVQVYAWIGGNSPAEFAKAAQVKIAAGYTALKMAGAEEAGQLRFIDTFAKIETMVASVAAVRAAVGPTIGLGVDFHGVPHKGMAKVLAREIEPFHPLFIEEPVLPENSEALREIAHSTTTPIATGERMYSRWDFKRVLQEGYVDIVQPDLVHAGGISEVSKIAAMAEAYDVALAPHCPLGPVAFAASIQMDAAMPNAFIQEQVVEVEDIVNGLGMKYLVEPNAFALKDGYVSIPTGAGLGISVNEDAVRQAAAVGHHWRVPLSRNEDGTVSEW